MFENNNLFLCLKLLLKTFNLGCERKFVTAAHVLQINDGYEGQIFSTNIGQVYEAVVHVVVDTVKFFKHCESFLSDGEEESFEDGVGTYASAHDRLVVGSSFLVSVLKQRQIDFAMYFLVSSRLATVSRKMSKPCEQFC